MSLKIETPVFLSPLIKVCSTGEAPLHLGNKDKWTLIHPKEGNSKINLGSINP